MTRTHIVRVLVVLGVAGCGDNLRPEAPAPVTVIDRAPAPISSVTRVEITFHADGAASFTCGLDGAATAACESPWTFEVADGPHEAVIAATGVDGSAGKPATARFLVDTVAPDTAIEVGPSSMETTTLASFRFAASPAGDGATFECAVDGAGFTPCSSPSTVTRFDGAHAFHVRAIDAAGNADPTPAMHTWTVDTVAPIITITAGPTGTTPDTTPTFDFSIAGSFTAASCRIDADAFVPCAGTFTSSPLADGPHVFEVQADDDAGNTGSATRPFVVEAIVAMCGNGVVETGEECDGAALAGATCESLGHAPGALACAATCDAYDANLCDGGFVTANTGFTGTVCFDGMKFGSTPFVAACTEDAGVWRILFQAGFPEIWTSMNGTVAGQQVTNLQGRAVIPGADNPSTTFLVANAGGANSYRTNLFASTTQPIAWPAASQVTFAAAGMPIEMFSAKSGSSVNNVLGGWHPTLGAVVLHGNPNTAATVSTVGPMVTGTVTSITAGAFSLPSTDINIAVFGKTPAGAPATGGGIYWTCDQLGTAGGTYIKHDNGIPDGEQPLVAMLLPDPASFTSAARLCPTTMGMVGGFASTYYAALRGGGQIYKTTDGGENWVKTNTGLPAGAEVYSLAIDCSRLVTGFPNLCNDRNLLYAATSLGLYKSMNAGATWTLAGLEGKVVRGVTLPSDHPVGTAPRVVVGVDDAVKIYQKTP